MEEERTGGQSPRWRLSISGPSACGDYTAKWIGTDGRYADLEIELGPDVQGAVRAFALAGDKMEEVVDAWNEFRRELRRRRKKRKARREERLQTEALALLVDATKQALGLAGAAERLKDLTLDSRGKVVRRKMAMGLDHPRCVGGVGLPRTRGVGPQGSDGVGLSEADGVGLSAEERDIRLMVQEVDELIASNRAGASVNAVGTASNAGDGGEEVMGPPPTAVASAGHERTGPVASRTLLDSLLLVAVWKQLVCWLILRTKSSVNPGEELDAIEDRALRDAVAGFLPVAESPGAALLRVVEGGEERESHLVESHRTSPKVAGPLSVQGRDREKDRILAAGKEQPSADEVETLMREAELMEYERRAERWRQLDQSQKQRHRRARVPLFALARIRRLFLLRHGKEVPDNLSFPVGDAASWECWSRVWKPQRKERAGGSWWKEEEQDEATVVAGVARKETTGDTLVYSSAKVRMTLTGEGETKAKSIYGLVDSGAGASIIGSALVEELGLPVEAPQVSKPGEYLRSASGEYMKLSGTAWVEFMYENGVTARWACHVVPNFTHGLLLGNDYLDECEAEFSFKQKTFMARGFEVPIPLLFSSQAKGVLVVDEEVKVPGSSRVLMLVRAAPGGVPRWYKEGMTVEIERTEAVMEEKGCVIAAAWDVFSPEGTVIVQVANPHPEPVVLSEGYPIAQYGRPDILEGATISLLNPEEGDEMKSEAVLAAEKAAAERGEGGEEDAGDGRAEETCLRSVEQPSDEDWLAGDPAGQDFREEPSLFEDLKSKETPEERAARVRSEAHIAARLSKEERAWALELLLHHRETFKNTPGFTGVAELEINTGDSRPVSRKGYRNPMVANAGFLRQLEQWEDEGIVRRSSSAWSAPAMVVPKKNGTWRTVIDYRGLNKLLAKESNPVPIIHEVLDAMGGSQYFSTMDLTSGYYQLGVREKDKPKTAFTTPFGLFEFNRCPQGISNAVPTFQRTMELLLRGSLGICALVFLDDVIVYSATFEQHLKDLHRVLSCIGQAGMTFKLSKCHFFENSVEYLGHIISDEGVRVCPDKVVAVKEFPQPEGPTKVKSFLGLSGFYRRFVKDYSVIARPLYDLTKKKTVFKWNPKAQEAFDTLKEALCTAPVLQYPDFAKPMEIHVDACPWGGGAVLCQKGADDLPHPIAYWSTVFNEHQLNYGTVEQECLALVLAIKHFRPYILGRPIRVLTDHAPLRWLNNIADPSGRLTRWAIMLQDYQIEIEYRRGVDNGDADGISRAHAKEESERGRIPTPLVDEGDTLEAVKESVKDVLVFTRAQAALLPKVPVLDAVLGEDALPDAAVAPVEAPYEDGWPVRATVQQRAEGLATMGDAEAGSSVPLSEETSEWLASTVGRAWTGRNREKLRADLAAMQAADPALHPMLQLVGLRPGDPEDVPNWVRSQSALLTVHGGVLYRAVSYKDVPESFNALVVPKQMKAAALLAMAHDDPLTGGHLGATKVFDKLKQRYWWEKMNKEVGEHCAECAVCATSKGRLGVAPYQNVPLPERPFQMIGIDTVGMLTKTKDGNQYIIVITDYLTRWVEAVAVKSDNAATVAKVLLSLITRHGAPERVLSDRGASYMNEVVDHLLVLMRTQHVTTPAYRPQMNGLTERCNGTIKRMLKTYANENQTDWDQYLELVLFAYRTSYQSSLRSTPFGMLYGREARLPLDTVWLEEEEPPYDPTDYRHRLGWAMALRRDWARRCMEKVQKRREREQSGAEPRKLRKPKARVFKVGDEVMMHTKPKSKDDITASFSHAWRGPFTVMKRLGLHVYQLKASPIAMQGDVRWDNPKVQADRLKKYQRKAAKEAQPKYTVEELLPYLGPKWATAHNNSCELCAIGGQLLCCDWCNVAYHLSCINPLPEGWQNGDDWACPVCWMEAANVAEGYPVSAWGADGLLDSELVALGGSGAVVGRAPANRKGRKLSKRQLERRPKKAEEFGVKDMDTQDRIVRHKQQRNNSGRVETVYWTVPRGTGAYVVNHGRFLTGDQVDPAALLRYRELMGLEKPR